MDELMRNQGTSVSVSHKRELVEIFKAPPILSTPIQWLGAECDHSETGQRGDKGSVINSRRCQGGHIPITAGLLHQVVLRTPPVTLQVELPACALIFVFFLAVFA